MIYLPPYSPELNPIERKWNHLKQLLKGYYDNTKSFIDNLCLQVNNLTTSI
jgi:transposase